MLLPLRKLSCPQDWVRLALLVQNALLLWTGWCCLPGETVPAPSMGNRVVSIIPPQRSQLDLSKQP